MLRVASFWLAIVVMAACRAVPAIAEDPSVFDSGRLLGTAGLSQVEGADGGGLAPWAVIAGYGTRDGIGADAHATTVQTDDFGFYTSGLAVGLFDRVELSYAHQWFDTQSYGARLGLGRGYTFGVDDVGAKVRLFGDAVYDQDRLLPQISLGVLFKSNDRGALLHALGARSAEGADFYVAATKLLLSQSILLNATVRLTRANQLGILGFGGDRNDGYQPEFEGSAALLLSRHLAIGAEYRTKPDNLSFAREDGWFDAFAAVFVTKNAALTVAYTNLGSIALSHGQNGVYLSLQVGF